MHVDIRVCVCLCVCVQACLCVCVRESEISKERGNEKKTAKTQQFATKAACKCEFQSLCEHVCSSSTHAVGPVPIRYTITFKGNVF